jgi:RecJ-like exonuclease
MNTAEKKCFKCHKQMPLADFYKHRKMADGHLNKCKECTKEDVRNHRKNPKYREKVLAYDRQRGNRQPPEYTTEYRKRFPQKAKAQAMVSKALVAGKIQRRDSCESCGGANYLHAHHDDYARPLDVRWLCASCHSQWHAKHGEGKNGRELI